jgi:quinol monooxygenase YgiN
MAPARMTIQWLVPVGRTRSMSETLHALMAVARGEPGCVRCSLSADLAERGTLRYTEDWDSEDELRQQFQTSRFRSLLALLEDAIEPPLIEFTLPSGVRGLDYVNEPRRGPATGSETRH